ncbi:hypothetical protein ACWF94_24150 [Streptomyces sp. NPDC055078]
MTDNPQQDGAQRRPALPPEPEALPKRTRVLSDAEISARQRDRWERRADRWLAPPEVVETPDGRVWIELPPGTPRGPFPQVTRTGVERLYAGLAKHRDAIAARSDLSVVTARDRLRRAVAERNANSRRGL